MITNYNEFILELKKSEHKPLEGSAGNMIDGKFYSFNVGKLVKWCEENYKPEDLQMSKIKGMSFFLNLKHKEINHKIKAFAKREDDGSLSVCVIPDGGDIKKELGSEFKNYHKMTQDEWDEYRKDQMKVIKWADLTYPIICTADNKGKITGILDGNHRAAKAELENKKTIKAYIIPEKDIKGLSKRELDELKFEPKQFVPGVWGDKDENYSIDKLVKLVKDRKPTTMSIDEIIDKNVDLETIEGNFKDNIVTPTKSFEKRTKKANIKYPVMISEDGWIIDGSHRIAKQKWEGIKNVKVHIISKEDLKKSKITVPEELKKSKEINV